MSAVSYPARTAVVPVSSGGVAVSRVVSASGTNLTAVKTSPGQVYGWALFNATDTAVYVKLYNMSSTPSVGSSTPYMTILVPGSPGGAGSNVEYTNGIPFGTGIHFAVTTGAADSDAVGVGTGDVIVNLFYK